MSSAAAGRTRPVNLGPKQLATNGGLSNELRVAGNHGALPHMQQMPLLSSSGVEPW